MDEIGNLLNKASLETKNGNFQAAISAYKNILELADNTEQSCHLSYWGIGEIYLNTRQISEAVSYLSKAVELAPDQANYQYLLGCAFTYEGNIDKAIHHLEIAIQLDDSFWEFWNQLGWVVGFNKDVDKGIEYLKKSISLEPEKSKSYRDLSILYSQKLNWEVAILVIEEAIAAEPEDEENYRVKAQLEKFKEPIARLKDNSQK
jgi:superkiller protein 3